MTRIEQAKNGIITDEMKQVAQQEKLDAEAVRRSVVDGTITIVRNSQRSIKPLAIGAGTRIKINANIGTSSSLISIDEEVAKMKASVECGADAVMDLSTAGDLAAIRKALIKECPVAIGTVPIYEMAVRARENKKSILDITANEMFAVIEDHCKQGIDFLTIHCGVNQQTVARFKEVNRLAGAVSRGGTILMEWIHQNGRENPLV